MQPHFLEKCQLLLLDIFRSHQQLMTIQFQSSYILSQSLMTSLKVAATHAEVAYLLSPITILETKQNQTKT